MKRKSTALTPPRPRARRFTWRHVTLAVTHTKDYLRPGQSHLRSEEHWSVI